MVTKMADDDLPLEHVIRPALPWRDEKKTECGREPNEHAISREEFVAKVKKQGKTRAAMTTCMTCFETAARWHDWKVDPAAVMYREIKDTAWRGRWADPSTQINDELRAIELLIAAHRDEFDETLASLRSAVSFRDLQMKRRREDLKKRRGG